MRLGRGGLYTVFVISYIVRTLDIEGVISYQRTYHIYYHYYYDSFYITDKLLLILLKV